MTTPKTYESLPGLNSTITVEGESFDISNLLGSLPEGSTGTGTGTDAETTQRRFYPSISKLLNNSTHHELRDSFLGQGGDSFAYGEGDRRQSDAMPELSELRESISKLLNNSSHHKLRPSLMSRRTDSFASFMGDSFAFGEGDRRQSDAMPGLAKLEESTSTFQDSHGQADFLTGGTSDDIAYSNDSSTTIVEVNPGVFLPFRRSDETWMAIQAGFYTMLTCFDCGLDMVAANDDNDQYNYAHVVCPDCHTVNPLLQSDELSSTRENSEQQVAAAMGFKKHWCGDQLGSDNDNNHDNW